MSPKVLCQRSFFALAPNPRRPFQCVYPFGHLPFSPAFQQLLAEPAHLLDHPTLRLVGSAQVIPGVLDKIDQSLNASAQLRMLVKPGQQALILRGQHGMALT